jgi:subtilisin family serine protease
VALVLVVGGIVLGGSAAAAGSAPPLPEAPAGFDVPNDTFLAEQWAVLDLGQPIGGSLRGTPDVDVRLPEAWAVTRGDPSVTVAVLDSGITMEHPDLQRNIWTNPGESGADREANGIDDDHDGFVDDVHGWDFVDGDNAVDDVRTANLVGSGGGIAHGTAVASVIAAASDNGTGMAGVAPRTTLLPVRVVATQGWSDSDLAAGIDYAAAHGARIANISLGVADIAGFGDRPLTDQAIRRHPDVLFVVAAGNSGADADTSQTTPCLSSADNVLCVAATDQDDHLASFADPLNPASDYGATTVDLGAPGDNILVATPQYETVWHEDFSLPMEGRWSTTGGTWHVDSDVGAAVPPSLSDAAGGTFDTSSVRMIEPIELGGRHDCRLSIRYRSDLPAAAGVFLETSADGASFALRVGATGFSVDQPTSGSFSSASVPVSTATGRLWLGFRAQIPPGPPGLSMWLDDLAVDCAGLAEDGRAYAYVEGTSFAAPHVSGIAALVLALHPDMTVVDLERAIVQGGVAVPALAGKTVSGRRADAYGALLAADRLSSAAPGRERQVSTPSTAPGITRGELIDGLVLPLHPLDLSRCASRASCGATVRPGTAAAPAPVDAPAAGGSSSVSAPSSPAGSDPGDGVSAGWWASLGALVAAAGALGGTSFQWAKAEQGSTFVDHQGSVLGARVQNMVEGGFIGLVGGALLGGIIGGVKRFPEGIVVGAVIGGAIGLLAGALYGAMQNVD